MRWGLQVRKLSDVAYHQIVTGNSAKDDHENGRGKRAVLEQIGALAPTIYNKASSPCQLSNTSCFEQV